MLPCLRTLTASAIVALIAPGCATTSAARAHDPVSFELEHEAVQATTPAEPVRAVFAWSLTEPDGRFSGDGVARIAPGYRARLDLFGPRGEGYLTASLVEDRLRLPDGFQPGVPVPPPALLWSTIGVFQPPSGAELTATRRQAGRTQLEYVRGSDRWRFALEAGRLVRAEMDTRQGRHSVELRGNAPFRLPRQAVYRDLTAFRELVLNLVEADRADGFPPEIWTPDA